MVPANITLVVPPGSKDADSEPATVAPSPCELGTVTVGLLGVSVPDQRISPFDENVTEMEFPLAL